MKTVSILTLSFTAFTLSACGATTGGLAKSMAQNAAMTAVSNQAQPQTMTAQQTVPTVQAVSVTDGSLDCEALSQEIANTDIIIAEANSVISGGNGANVAGQVAVAGAQQAALQSGAASAVARVPFGGLFAKAAMDSVANAQKKKVEQAQADLQAANMRKASLNGLYIGKNCGS